MAISYATDIPNPDHQWIPQNLADKINDLTKLLDILKHPFMTTPIDDMGLAPETTDFLKAHYHIYFGGHLLAKETLNDTDCNEVQVREIYSVLQKNELYMSDLVQIAFRLDERQDTISRWENAHDKEVFERGLQKSISYATSRLESAEAERQSVLWGMQVISIELPTTLKLLNSPETISHMTLFVLQDAFTKAVQESVSTTTAIETAQMVPEKLPQESFFQRVTERLASIVKGTKGEDGPYLDMHTHYVDSFRLEFAASPTPLGDKEHNTYDDLNSVFYDAAKKLSGTTLTKAICASLDPTTVRPKANEALPELPQTEPWLTIHTPRHLG